MHLLDYRINSGIRYENFNGEVKDIGKVFARWLDTEVGWGTQVKELTETHLYTQTHVMAAEDNMIFTGTEEEMRPFVKAASLTVFMANRQLKDEFKNELPLIMEVTKGIPLWIECSAGMVLGRSRVRFVCLALLCEQYPERLDQYKDLALDDLITATRMYLFENTTHDELAMVV